MAVDISSMIAPASKALAPAGGTLSEAWQAVIGDRVAAWRLTNAAKLQTRVNKALGASGLKFNGSKIPERYAFTWFEEATKQDEPEIQELFAQLLARAAMGDKDANDRRHIETLSRFTPMDARIFDFVFEVGKVSKPAFAPDAPPYLEMHEHELLRAVKRSFGAEAWMSVEHLTVLGILERQTSVDRTSLKRLFESADLRERRGFFIPAFSDLELDVRLAVTISGFSLRRALGKMEP